MIYNEAMFKDDHERWVMMAGARGHLLPLDFNLPSRIRLTCTRCGHSLKPLWGEVNFGETAPLRDIPECPKQESGDE